MIISRTLAAAMLLSAATAAVVESAAYAAGPADLVSIYKDLHSHPELGFQETRSAAIMAAEARAAGFTVTEKVGGTGVVAVMVNGPGPVVLIRADMDGLPVKEMTGLPYASTATGKAPDGSDTPVMHACGHDIHMTSWIGVARQMAARKADWSGTLVMIGQPAEEVVGGARAMLKDGLFTRFPRPDFALALHDSAAVPAGSVSVPARAALAASSGVDIEVRGVGGHGAYPSTTRDPIVLAARIVGALQTLVSRESDPFQPAVVTVGSFHGGTKRNIIPDSVRLELTVRSYDAEQHKRLFAGIERIARGEAIAAGVPDALLPTVKASEGATEATLNTPALAARLQSLFETRLGKARVMATNPSMAGEDFNQYNLADPRIQTTIFWVGGVPQAKWDTAQNGGPAIPSLHNSGWAPDPAPTIATGVEAMTAAALDLLAKK